MGCRGLGNVESPITFSSSSIPNKIASQPYYPGPRYYCVISISELRALKGLCFLRELYLFFNSKNGAVDHKLVERSGVR